MKFVAALAIVTAVAFGASDAEAKDKNKSKNKPRNEVVQVVPKPVVVPTPAPTPAPKPAIDPYTQSQIDKALANKAPIGVTTYGAMAAAVQAGANGGDPIAAAEAASAGW